MVQLLLSSIRRQWRGAAMFPVCAGLFLSAAVAAPKGNAKAIVPEQYQMSMDGPRSLTWEHSFNSERQVKPNRSIWDKVVDFVAGEPDYHFLVNPYSVVTDSRGRVLVTDPGAEGVHIFDFNAHKYKLLQRTGKSKDNMLTPQCVAVDAQDNIYVTDSQAGEVFVFAVSGKFLRVIGSLKGGEGYFKRPTGIAVDSAAQRIYVTDTLRDQVFVLDMEGNIVGKFGSTGSGNGEFNLPTEVKLDGANLLVVDAMNFRVQVFDRAGTFQYSIGGIGDGPGSMFRPKGVAVDSEGDVYVVDSWLGGVQAFDRKGDLLYYFGSPGTRAGQFQLPAGLSIDHGDQVFVVDSFNRRVQVFQYAGLKAPSQEGVK